MKVSLNQIGNFKFLLEAAIESNDSDTTHNTFAEDIAFFKSLRNDIQVLSIDVIPEKDSVAITLMAVGQTLDQLKVAMNEVLTKNGFHID